MKDLQLNRRRFLQRTVAVAGTALGAQYMPSILSAADAGNKFGIAVIGCGGMGGGNPGVAANERLVALVDVDEKQLGDAVKRVQAKVSSPKTYYDHRKMYDECMKDIDVVLIATPDHHHAPAAIRAIKAGKAVFVQKPLAHDIRECYVLAKAAKENKALTQMGNQGHYGDNIRRVCEYIWAGAIGNVTEVHAIMGRNFGGSGGRPASKPVPAGPCTGMNGSGRPTSANTTITSIPSIGAHGGNSAPAPSATWRATTWTHCSGR